MEANSLGASLDLALGCAAPTNRFDGDGIVICAGGAHMFTNAYVLIHILRRHFRSNCKIELWYLGKKELSPRMQGLLEELEVSCIDASAVFDTTNIDGWRLKTLAICESRFQNVLLIDADNIPVRDPAEAFDWPHFTSTGALLWPDIIDIAPENPIWAICNLRNDFRISAESGQLLIDKNRHWRALQYAATLNHHADIVYQHIYGDKDTILLGLIAEGREFSMVSCRPKQDIGRCLYQHDPSGAVFFQHRTGAKWRYSGNQIRLDGFVHSEACEDALKDLRRNWNGLIFHTPVQTLAAKTEQNRLAAGCALQVLEPGNAPFVLQLLSSGELGAGRRPDMMNWYCRTTGDTVELIFRDAFCDIWALSKIQDGLWVGCSSSDPNRQLFAREGAPASEQKAVNRFTELWLDWPRRGYYEKPASSL